MNEGRICGSGAVCEATCPVKALGRVCPSVAELLVELAEINHPWLGQSESLARL